MITGSEKVTVNRNVDLFATHEDLLTDHGVAKSDIKQYEVVARNADGKIEPWSGTGSPIGVSLAEATANTNVNYWYSGGFFQHALHWPTAVNTIAKRKAAFDNTSLKVY